MSAKNKKITLEDLAQEMRSGFAAVDAKIKEAEKKIIENIDKKIDTKIDELAATTKNGFDEVDGRLNNINERLIDLDKSNTQAHEDMALRLDNVAYRFELVDLKKRVEALEKKSEIRV